MTTITRKLEDSLSPLPVKGVWWRWKHLIMVTCPKCGVAGILDHEVARDGTVTPSLECVHKQTCGFHEMVRLADWDVN